MQERELLQVALGLAEPWRVARTEFSAQERRLDIYLDFPRGARFPCPEGDQPTCPVHDMTPKHFLVLAACLIGLVSLSSSR